MGARPQAARAQVIAVAIYRVIEPRLGQLRLADWRRRGRRVLGLLLLVVLLCAVGLALLDNSSDAPELKLLQGLWNALNLVTTLGDFSPFDRYQKLFVMVVMIGVAVIGAYAVAQMTGLLSDPAVVAYRENRRMDKAVDRLHGHTVVIGYVGVGRVLAERLRQAGQPVVVIDRNEDAAALAAEHGLLVVKGDAGIDEGTLLRAGTDRAAALIVATRDMDRNVAITLMAHSGNPALRVIAFAEDARRADLLRRAGASQVVVIDQLLTDAIAAQLTAAG